MDTKFDDIRPYTDAEIPAAMKRIVESEHFNELAKFVYPNQSAEEVRKIIGSYTRVRDFQEGTMAAFNSRIMAQTITNFTYRGVEMLDPSKSYLFISNHRDIVVDSMLLQFILHSEGFRTTEITFGSNLMSSQLITDIGCANKMFKVMRGENPRDFYKTSQHLSEYIRHTITRRGESIWIAQRNGRTKDGNDATDQGILKMFCMSGGKDFAQSIGELNIVPIAISYQWEPCDFFKTKELYLSRGGAKYVKQKDEDIISILTGITQQKGNVHLSLCKPLKKEEYIDFVNETPNKFYTNIANLIDKRIYDNYMLFCTNYIAYDIISGTNKYVAHYTSAEKDIFLQKFHQVQNKIDGDKEIISSIYLNIYANPVNNCSV